MSLGRKLKMAREQRNWSQKFVASKLGISNTVLSNYERDYRDPDTETLKKLSELYGVSIDYLLGRVTDGVYRNHDKELELTEKDEKDIAKRMEKMKKDLIEGNADGEGLNFMGEPMSEEAIESLLAALEHAERIATLTNKKFTPKKYRDKK